MKGRPALVAMVLLVALAGAPAGKAGEPPSMPAPVHAARAFRVEAQAFPSELAPGTQGTEVAVRQLATRAAASNPPPDAFARAAANDAGLAEAYFGRQGPSADVDTATADGRRDQVVEEGGSRLEGHADPAPSARASAAGNVVGGEAVTTGSGRSAAAVDAAGEHLVAVATADVNDLAVGSLVIGSGRFEAVVRSDGRPGGAVGTGTVRTSEVSFDGIPVVIGTDGLRVDDARVPDALLGPTTAALREGLARGGYTDIRLVHPEVAIAEDGTSASVSGGGVFVHLTNNDPTQRYFVSVTLLGGSVEVLFGGDVATEGVLTGPPSMAGSAPPFRAGGTASLPPGTVGSPPAPAPGPGAGLAYAQGAERVALRGTRPGWLWVVGLVGGAWAAAGLLRLPIARGVRARLAGSTDGFVERYLRG